MYKIFLLVFLSVFSCNRLSKKGGDKIIARVHDEYLYASELEKVIPTNLSGNDSVILAEDYLNKWVRKQLLLFKAQINLTEDEKEVQRQIAEYEASLLIFKYEQKYLTQSLDTSVSTEEMKDYYDKYGNNFMLDNHLVKGLYVKVPKSAPSIGTLRRNIRNGSKEAIEEVDIYCRQYAEDYNFFRDTWIDFNILAQTLPKTINNTENYLRYRKFDEVRDTAYHYFLRIEDYQLANNIAPFEYVVDDIRSIIINKRKVKLINELESTIYNEGLNHSYFNIY